MVLSDDWVLPFDELIDYSELVVRVRARARVVCFSRERCRRLGLFAFALAWRLGLAAASLRPPLASHARYAWLSRSRRATGARSPISYGRCRSIACAWARSHGAVLAP